jgi:hypothetical protein
VGGGLNEINGREDADKEAKMKEYQKRLLKSVEKRTNKQSSNQFGYSSIEPTNIQAEDLKK